MLGVWVIPCRWTEDAKLQGAGTKSGESGAGNLEAESIRSRAEYGDLFASKDKITDYLAVITKFVFWLTVNGLFASKTHN